MTSSHKSDYIVKKLLQYLIVKKLTIGIRHLKDSSDPILCATLSKYRPIKWFIMRSVYSKRFRYESYFFFACKLSFNINAVEIVWKQNTFIFRYTGYMQSSTYVCQICVVHCVLLGNSRSILCAGKSMITQGENGWFHTTYR